MIRSLVVNACLLTRCPPATETKSLSITGIILREAVLFLSDRSLLRLIVLRAFSVFLLLMIVSASLRLSCFIIRQIGVPTPACCSFVRAFELISGQDSVLLPRLITGGASLYFAGGVAIHAAPRPFSQPLMECSGLAVNLPEVKF